MKFNPKRLLNYDESTHRGQMDMPFFLLTVLLTCVGLVMMFSASYARAYQEVGNSAYFLVKQGKYALIGMTGLLVISIVDYQWWRLVSIGLLPFSVLLLFLVLVAGTSGGGATRWLAIGPITIQPSEITKLGVVLLLATMYTGKREWMLSRNGIITTVLGLIVIVGLLYLQPHLSAIIIIGGVTVVMMYLGGVKFRVVMLMLIAAAVGFTFVVKTGYFADRISAWRDPWADPSDKGYQIIQSLYAIGSGGLFGLGFGKSRQKYLYLPEEHNDYIFPIVCEELGFVGATVIILLFVLLILRGYWIAMHAKDRFGAMIAAGITTLLAMQVFFNIGVVTNFLPSTGISLPFFSYGGTALMLQLAQMGIVLSVSRSSDNNLL